jgi:hypothetical protein
MIISEGNKLRGQFQVLPIKAEGAVRLTIFGTAPFFLARK